jgi:biopolymer transport protein TolR
MAATLNGRGGGSSRRGRLMSEINVTPFVDVMLVLLVVFMVTAPLLTVGVPVNLPKTKASVLPGHKEPLVVSVESGDKVYLMDHPVTLDQLVPRLTAMLRNAPDQRIFIRGDKSVSYGNMMQVMGAINAAGFTHVALVTQPVNATGPKPRARR